MIERFLPQVSSFAGDIDFLIGFVAVVTMGWFFAAQAIFFGFILKFRAKPGVKAQHIDGYNPKHKRWITYPHNAVLVFDVFILVFAVRVWNHVKIDLPEHADETVKVIGQRWAWSFQHAGADGKLDTPDDVFTAEELHVKKGDNVVFIGTSRDVLHSFSVPVFRLKQDVIPGREGTGWFKAEKAGTYDIQCTEICGIGHGVMYGRVIVHEAADFDAWLASAPKGEAIAGATPLQPTAIDLYAPSATAKSAEAAEPAKAAEAALTAAAPAEAKPAEAKPAEAKPVEAAPAAAAPAGAKPVEAKPADAQH
jgi:cytochrome c oxidase subunit 2